MLNEIEKGTDAARIVEEEERLLARVEARVALGDEDVAEAGERTAVADYDRELLSLRDAIAEAKPEDLPPLVEQMTRLAAIRERIGGARALPVDMASPYFAHMVLREGEQGAERHRDVLVGKRGFIDRRSNVQIVDWRNAPISQVYYRYDEGDDYEETVDGRTLAGVVEVRRNVSINKAKLRRIGAPQGTYVRDARGVWREAVGSAVPTLQGGQGKAARAPQPPPRALARRGGKRGRRPAPSAAPAEATGLLGVHHGPVARADKHLPEIAALIDSRQFELITKPDSGLVVIQGGAGSGKTTIGLHRLAYLAYRDKQRFRPERMLVVVFNDALARYISFVLPALGVNGVAVTTFHAWARKHRLQHVPRLPDSYTDDAPEAVVRLKKHPAWPRIIEDRASKLEAAFEQRVRAELGDEAQAALSHWRATEGQASALRARQLIDWVTNNEDLRTGFRHALEREARALIERTDVVLVWAELLTDRRKLNELFAHYAPGDFTEGQIDTVFRWCTKACGTLVADIEQREEERAEKSDEPELDESEIGADGMEERSAGALDWEDDALLLRIYQRLRSPLRRGKDALSYEHVFVDEAQDLSPLELAVVLGTSRSDSVTLAGDVAQRLMLDNGFSDWKSVLGILGLSHVEIEPLNVSYRSTHEIMEFANHVLGPLRPPQVGRATRHGVPVELFRFSHTGEGVGFLAESLRALCAVEPLASVAVISRTPEQARVYAEGLQHAEVPNVRLIAEQDFPFRAGIDVTDVRQVKGLEFDYVVLVEVTAHGYPDDDESRHLLHIGASRAAHQLWIVTGDQPSTLLPPELCERGY